MVTDADIIKFQKLYRSRFGIELNHSRAKTKLEALVRQVSLIYKPISKEQLEAVKNWPKANRRRPRKDRQS